MVKKKNLKSNFFFIQVNDVDSWYKFLSKLCEKNLLNIEEEEDEFKFSSIREEFFFCLISNENYSEIIKFSSFLGYTLYSLSIIQNGSTTNENFKNFRNLASFLFQENSLIAPSPNLSWISTNSSNSLSDIDLNEGKKNLIFMLKECLLKLNSTKNQNLSKEQNSILLFSLGDLYYFENDFKNCLKFYLKSINQFLLNEEEEEQEQEQEQEEEKRERGEEKNEIKMIEENILKRIFQCLNSLNLYTAGAVVYQFLNLNYDTNLLNNLKSLDRIWLPYFYDSNYLEIFLLFESQKDLILKLMSRVEINKNNSILKYKKFLKNLKKKFFKRLEIYLN